MSIPSLFFKWLREAPKLSLVLGIVVLILALTGSMALAHGLTALDGVLTDWCFPGLLTGAPDTRTTLTPPGGCGVGFEVLWEDTPGDAGSLLFPANPVDISTFATTGDPANLNFAITYASSGAPAHFQIAIDVPGGIGTPTWFDPLGAFFPNTVGTFAAGGIAPDYLIAIDSLGVNPVLYEAASNPGAWTPLAPVPMAPGPGIIEIQIPWSSFMGGGPAFGPGTTAQMTVLATYDDSVGPPFCTNMAGSPCVGDFENDIFSEPSPGTFTTTVNPCPPGPGSVGCELMDTSADAFITVVYQTPSAVELTEMNTQSQSNSLAPILGALLLGSSVVWLVLRRKRDPKQV